MATTTINTTGAEDARIVVAFGRHLGLGRNATQLEITAEVRRFVTQIVRDQETSIAAAAAYAAAAISPT